MDASNATNGSILVLFDPYAPTLTLFSCSLSVIGSLSIVLSFIYWKESRSTSRAILLCIALSDLVSALGYIFGAGLFLGTFPAPGANATPAYDGAFSVGAWTARSMEPFSALCQAQSFITTTGMMWSFWWTTILSLHLFVSVAKMQLDFSRKLFPLYFVLATGVPLFITIPTAATGWLGIGNSTASVSWCFIRLKLNRKDPTHPSLHYPAYDILEFVAGKMWELVAFILIFSLYVALKSAMSKRRRNLEHRPLLHETSWDNFPRLVENKLLLVPLLFIISRLFGMLRYALSLVFVFTNYTDHPLVDNVIYNPVLVGLHAFFEGSQGWINGLLFVVLSERGLRFASWFCLYFKHCCCPLYIGPCCSCYKCCGQRQKWRNEDKFLYHSESSDAYD